ncbi:MAG: hypothetical protein NTW25_12430 [Candidatus Kapabacteria bacterium]|nr:hypothetical protein [Candidatus Kapabacteria bacterium]
MGYQIINNLPFGFVFKDKTKSEFNQYKEWFETNKEDRLKQLIRLVQSSQEFENWEADFSKYSLKRLGAWLKENIEVEKLSQEEYKLKRLNVPDYIEINDWDLTNKTYSKLIDIGIYFGEVFIKNHSNLKWEQYFSKIKNDNNQGHMVIKGFGKVCLNPLNVIYVVGLKMVNNLSDTEKIYIAYKRSDNLPDSERIYKLYETWETYLTK